MRGGPTVRRSHRCLLITGHFRLFSAKSVHRGVPESQGAHAGDGQPGFEQLVEEFTAGGRRCITVFGSQCEGQGTEYVDLRGSFLIEQQMVTWSGLRFYCSYHAFCGIQLLANNGLQGTLPTRREFALIALRAGQTDATLRSHGDSMNELRQELELVLRETHRAQERVRHVEFEAAEIHRQATDGVLSSQHLAEAAEVMAHQAVGLAQHELLQAEIQFNLLRREAHEEINAVVRHVEDVGAHAVRNQVEEAKAVLRDEALEHVAAERQRLELDRREVRYQQEELRRAEARLHDETRAAMAQVD